MPSLNRTTIAMRVLLLVLAAAVPGFARAAQDYDFTPVTLQIEALLAAHPEIPGASLIVTHDHGVIDEEYFGAFGPATILPIASASKWLSALAIERLVEKDEMSWNDSVGDYIPDAPPDKLDITLGQLFSHTSGLSPTEDPCLGDQANYTLATCAQQILNGTLVYPPGSAFAYSGNDMQVGAWMAELATGESWDQIFRDEITTPLGMTQTDFATNSTEPPYVTVPNPYVAGGVRSSLADYGHVVQMVAQQGRWNGTPFLSAYGIARMQQDQTHGAPILYSPDEDAYGYGYGEWRDIVDAEGNAVQVSSTGRFATSPWVDNETGVGAVFLTFSDAVLIRSDVIALWANVRAVVTGTLFSNGFD